MKQTLNIKEKGKKIKITDTTLRDGQQSLWATRMRFDEMLPVLEKLDGVGYWSLEMWGGATFDVCIRYLNEDPWTRLSEIRKHIKKTKLQMLLRGQNIVGYKNYPDDLLEKFIEKTCELGLDIFRVFDALNDIRNLEMAIKFVKKFRKEAQGTICYTISPVHTTQYYLKFTRQLLDLGVDSICIKDMAGILAPNDAFRLVSAIKEKLGDKIPLQLHSHASSGMVVATYLKAIEAGVDIIDTAHAPLAFGTSQPAIETILAILDGTENALELNKDLINEISEHFEKIKEARNITFVKFIDELVISHQIPGGMASNLIAQLKEQKAESRLKEVLEEVPKVRHDLGYPPLVTPTSQIVGVQAVFNVLTGERYKVVPKEVKDYVKGLYGKPPVPIKETLKRKILGPEKEIDSRPADLLQPIYEKIKAEVPKELVEKDEDYITYGLFPEIGLKFFKERHNPLISEERKNLNGLKEVRVNKTDGINLVKDLIDLASKHNIAELEWEFQGNKVRIKRGEIKPILQNESVSQRVVTPEPPVTEKKPEPVLEKKYDEIKSEMVGTFYSRSRPDAPPFVEKGDVCEPGQTLCIIEAMKLMNEIEAEKKCKIIDILVKDGEPVEYGQTLFLVEPLA